MSNGSPVSSYRGFRGIPVSGESIKPHGFTPAENLRLQMRAPALPTVLFSAISPGSTSRELSSSNHHPRKEWLYLMALFIPVSTGSSQMCLQEKILNTALTLRGYGGSFSRDFPNPVWLAEGDPSLAAGLDFMVSRDPFQPLPFMIL